MLLLKNDVWKNTVPIRFIGPSSKPGGICSTTSCEGLGLILMLTYFSFANDVARLQSARLNIHGEKNRLHGDADPSLSFSLRRSAPLPVTPSTRGGPPGCVWFYYAPCTRAGVSPHGYRQVCAVGCENGDTSHSHPPPPFSHYIH